MADITPLSKRPTAIIATMSITKGATVFSKKPNTPQKKDQSNTFERLDIYLSPFGIAPKLSKG